MQCSEIKPERHVWETIGPSWALSWPICKLSVLKNFYKVRCGKMWTTTRNSGSFHIEDTETPWQGAAEGSCRSCDFFLTVSMDQTLTMIRNHASLWSYSCAVSLLCFWLCWAPDFCGNHLWYRQPWLHLLLKPGTDWAVRPLSEFSVLVLSGFRDCSFRTTVLLRTWDKMTPGIHLYL